MNALERCAAVDGRGRPSHGRRQSVSVFRTWLAALQAVVEGSFPPSKKHAWSFFFFLSIREGWI